MSMRYESIPVQNNLLGSHISIGYSAQLTHIFDSLVFLPYFYSRMSTSMWTWNKINGFVLFWNETHSDLVSFQ